MALLGPLVLCILAAPPQDGDFLVPQGFRVTRAAVGGPSFLACCLDDEGRLLLSTERAGILLAEDTDGDGFFESVQTLTTELQGAQGLTVRGGVLFAVASRPRADGSREHGLWRAELGPDAIGELRLLVPIDDHDEHGAHAVVFGPDGALYMAVGDSARIASAPEVPVPEETTALALPTLNDPSGFGPGRRWPFGFVARVDPDTGAWRYHSVGYRNHYDLAFTTDGTLLTVDSDMEWDVGLPWYRPVRLLVCREGDDHGSRAGSASRPSHAPNSPSAVVELGRGSPTGMAVHDGAGFPERFDEALLVGDWTNGRVLALHLSREDDGLVAQAEVLLQARGALNVTDLVVAADGSVLMVSGGRGTSGGVWRLAWTGARDGSSSGPILATSPTAAERLARRNLTQTLAAVRNEGSRMELQERAAPFPTGLPELDRELAVILALGGGEDAVARLLTALETQEDRAQRIHYADCLRAVQVGWTTERRGRALAFFEEAAAWSGGGNLQGYLQAMLESIAQQASADEVRELAEADALGPRALATLLASRGPELAASLLEPLKSAFRELDESEDPALAQDRKRALLNSLAGARVAGLAEWLRQVYEDEPRLRDEVLLRLAEEPNGADWERLVGGLGRGRHEVREACVRALVKLPRRAQDPGTLRTVLDEVRERGPRGGGRLLKVLVHWSGRPIGAKDPAAWSGELAAWERWFVQTFPDWTAPERGPEAGPQWDAEYLLGFLERSAERPASPARGAGVFREATCHTCHTLGTVGSGWAPDLNGATRRFATRELLETLLDPSRVIAERFATTELTTVDGEFLEGRLVRETADELELLLANGTRATVPRDDLSTRSPSLLSAMPEGLLEPLTLEQVRDLLAYLGADGVVTEADDTPWLDLLADEQRGRWAGSFTGWRLAQGMLSGGADGSGSELLLFDRPLTDFELELDLFLEPDTRGAALRYRVSEGSPGERLDLDGEGWRHLHLTVHGAEHTLEVDGRALAPAKTVARGEGILAFERPTAGKIWITHVRLRPLGL